MRVNTTSFRFSIIVLILFSSPMHCEPRPLFACDPSDPKTVGFPFCNTKTNMSIRVQDLIVKLTLPEKISLLVDKAKPVDRLGIQGYEWWSEALHGVSNTGSGVQFGGKFPGATSFPQVITTAASLNASLWEAIGQVVSDEARAMYNWGQAGLTFWSPNVNIFRDPRWGRGQETPGEDPLIVSTYAVNYVKGLQGEEDRKNMLKVAACCKHYTAYDLDAWNGTDRFRFNAVVSEQDLEETYNVPFKACVSEGNVASIMCSYNQVNGKPTCADPILLRDTIRRQWKLNGYIVSDCDSVDVFFRRQHYTSTPEDAAAIAIKAGLDLDCGSFLGIHTMKAIQTRKLNVSDVDQALSNLITVQMRLGMYDGPTTQPYSNLGPNNVCTPAHQQLALEAAQQGIVLLKNLEWTLPLCSKWSPTIAVIGPNADATRTMIGNYAGVPCSYTSPLKGISEYVNTTYEIGCTTLKCFGNPHYREAERAACTARATVLVMGLDQSIEREGLDRVGLLLPGNQQNLVSRVAQASAGPVVLVIMSGGPVDITFAKNDPNIDAILWVGYPGQAGGTAIADVIFGKINPGGKLPMTWYPEEYLAKVPMTDMNMRSDPTRDYPGRTYKFYNGSVVYSFGDGLSYTHFKHTLANGPKELLIPSKNTTTLSSKGDIRVSDTACEALRLEVLIDVENVGELDGAETVMAFVTTPSKEKSLVGFKKSYLAVKAKVRVEFKIDPCQQMSIVDQYGIRRIEIGEYQIKFGEDLTYNVTLYTNKKKSVMF